MVVRGAWAPERCTAAGVLHGGYLMALADSAAATLAYLNLPAGATTATIEAKTNFLAAVREGSVTARAEAVHVGQGDDRRPGRRHATTRAGSSTRTLQTQAVIAAQAAARLACVAEHEHDARRRARRTRRAELTDAEAQAEAERLVRKEIALSQIRQYGDPVLRMRADEVEAFDDELRKVGERMIDLMHDADGVGLAATQVGILRRYFVCTIDGEDRVFVNPVVTPVGDDTDVDAEGCLSLGPVRVPVERRVKVTARGEGRRPASRSRSSSRATRRGSSSTSSTTWTAC